MRTFFFNDATIIALIFLAACYSHVDTNDKALQAEGKKIE